MTSSLVPYASTDDEGESSDGSVNSVREKFELLNKNNSETSHTDGEKSESFISDLVKSQKHGGEAELFTDNSAGTPNVREKSELLPNNSIISQQNRDLNINVDYNIDDIISDRSDHISIAVRPPVIESSGETDTVPAKTIQKRSRYARKTKPQPGYFTQFR
jgi:hypothetical protein